MLQKVFHLRQTHNCAPSLALRLCVFARDKLYSLRQKLLPTPAFGAF